jgi:hypothetical protein
VVTEMFRTLTRQQADELDAEAAGVTALLR